jgi:hypothetical protein
LNAVSLIAEAESSEIKVGVAAPVTAVVLAGLLAAVADVIGACSEGKGG